MSVSFFATAKSARKGRLVTCQISLTSDLAPPDWIELVPKGPSINALDGRKFRCSDPQLIVDRFVDHPYDLPIDYEHSSEIKAPAGEESPAAGWISMLEVRDGALWGKASWTPKGAASLINKEYRYISPAFTHDKDFEIQALVSAGLTNRPALVLNALARATDIEQIEEKRKMDPKLLSLLGLNADANIEAVLAAVESIKQDKEKVACELASSRTRSPSMDQYIPRSDYDIAIARAVSAEEKANKADKDAFDAAVASEMDSALKSGKITPATVEYYRSQCETLSGLEKFRAFCATAPVVVGPSGLDDKKIPAATDEGDQQLMQIAAMCHVTTEMLIAAK